MNQEQVIPEKIPSESDIRTTIYPEKDKGILLVEAQKSLSPIEWAKNHKDFIEQNLLKLGGILLRGFNIHSLSEFNQFSQLICPRLLEYTYRSTPRSNLGKNIYTATEYPADQSIPLHNENAYSDSWPEKIMFFCAIAAQEGGETPTADSREVLKRIDSNIVKKFEEKGVLYVRHYSRGIDLSWQEVFQTEDKHEVEAYCLKHSIEYCWGEVGPELITKQRCQATLVHPVTKEKVWFNQAHLFHISSLNKELAQTLMAEVGESLPRNAFYGDGTPIEEEVLNHIREAYEKEMIAFKWQRGDIMILDNVLRTHGRKPYSGARKIVVSMG